MSQASTAKQALERAAKDKTRIRIFYGDPETGKDDCDETDRSGKVYKTAAGLFVANSLSNREQTWNALHTIDVSRVVRIVKYGRGARKPTELYRHPSYTAGEWSCYFRSDLGRWIAIRNGLIHATFDTEVDAAIYADYIQGNRERTRYQYKAEAYAYMQKHRKEMQT